MQLFIRNMNSITNIYLCEENKVCQTFHQFQQQVSGQRRHRPNLGSLYNWMNLEKQKSEIAERGVPGDRTWVH